MDGPERLAVPQRREPGGDAPCWSVPQGQLHGARALGQQQLLCGDTDGAADSGVTACVPCFMSNLSHPFWTTFQRCLISVGIYNASLGSRLAQRCIAGVSRTAEGENAPGRCRGFTGGERAMPGWGGGTSS